MSASGYLKRSCSKDTTSVEVSSLVKYSNWRDLVTENKRLREVERFARMAVDGDIDESAKGWMLLSDVLGEGKLDDY